MKALDTNILVRFLTRDDEKQTLKVIGVLEEAERRGESLILTDLVLLETIWVLSYVKGHSRSRILNALQHLLLMPVLRFEAPGRIQKWVDLGRATNFELADLLIGLAARDLGCESTATLDRKAGRSDLFELI